MDNCKQCGKEISSIEGRKKKEFCDVNCRNKYSYAKRKKIVDEAIAILESNPAPQKTTIKDLTKVETAEIKPPATTNTTIDTLPKTLEEIKTLCPKELTGLERGKWIGQERLKYGI